MRIECEGLLFDNDGVLVDSHDQVVEAWTALAGEFDLDVEPLLIELVGVRAIDTLSRHLPADAAQQAVKRLEDLEVETAASTQPLAGALELLDSLPDRSWTIVTSASRRLAVARWRGAGIPVPDRVITAEGVDRGKPDPQPFVRGASILGLEAERCVVFEDSPSGGAAALAAGALVIAVGHQPWAGATARVDDLQHVAVEDRGPSLAVTIA